MPLKMDGSGAERSGEVQGEARCGMELIAQLDDPDPSTRRSAARDLIRFPEAVYVLVAHLLNERDRSVREAMLSTLAHLDDPAAVVCLTDFLRSEDPRLRKEAMETLKEFPGRIPDFIPETRNSRPCGNAPNARRASAMDQKPLKES